MLEWFSVPPGCWSLWLMQYEMGGFDQCSVPAELTRQHWAALILLLPGKQLTAIPAWPGSALRGRNALRPCLQWPATILTSAEWCWEIFNCTSVWSGLWRERCSGEDEIEPESWIPTLQLVFPLLMGPFLISKFHSKSCIYLGISL